jgi:hypothetical protein
MYGNWNHVQALCMLHLETRVHRWLYFAWFTFTLTRVIYLQDSAWKCDELRLVECILPRDCRQGKIVRWYSIASIGFPFMREKKWCILTSLCLCCYRRWNFSFHLFFGVSSKNWVSPFLESMTRVIFGSMIFTSILDLLRNTNGYILKLEWCWIWT